MTEIASICRFDFDAMCDLKGNTAVYLLYAHARIASIVRKADRPEVSDGTLAKSSSIDLQHPAEIALALHLIRYSLPAHYEIWTYCQNTSKVQA